MTIEPELIAPVLPFERPYDVLAVSLDGPGGPGGSGRSGLLVADLLGQLAAAGVQDLDEDGGGLVQQLLKLLEEPLVSASGEVSGVIHGDGASGRDILQDPGADGRVSERGWHLVEALLLFVEDPDVLQVSEQGTVAEGVTDHSGDLGGELGALLADSSEEFEEGGVILVLPDRGFELIADGLIDLGEVVDRLLGAVVVALAEVDHGLEHERLGIESGLEVG